MSYSAVNDAPICQLYSCTHSVLILPPGHLVDLIPCITYTSTRPYPLALPPVNPRNTDGTRTQKPAALTCYQCGQTGHTSWDCDLRHDVRHMTPDEQDEFIQHIMANCKGTSVRFLTSLILSLLLPVHMYSPSSPLYYLQGPYL
jgi:hypothetical protein